MQDKDIQKRDLENIYRGAYFAPIFERHPYFCINQFSNSIPYISYKDVMAGKYIIRGRPIEENNPYDTEEREIIAEYDNLNDLVCAGWRLN